MLTIDGTTTAAEKIISDAHTTAKSTKPIIPLDDGIPADLRRTHEVNVQVQAAGMIFLRRSGEHKHWVVQFTGLKAVQCDAALDVPLPCNATLRDVLAWLGTTYNGKLGGAWLLVAP